MPAQTLELHQLDRRLEHLRLRHPARFRRLLASLAENGQQTPIIVVPAQNRYLVIDGHQRVGALEQLRRDTVEATVWDLPESEALQLCASLRLRAEPETALEQGWLLAEMRMQLNCPNEELAIRFDRSASWVASRLALVETLPAGVQQQVREGRIAPQTAMRCLAPAARIDPDHCARMAAIFAARRWTTRQAAVLYQAWRSARNKTARERILAAPDLLLKTAQQPKPEEARGIERDLQQLVAIAARAAGRSPLELAGCPDLTARVEQAQQQLRRLAATATNTSSYADPITTSDDPGAARQGDRETRDRAAAESVAPKRAQNPAIAIHRGAEAGTGGEGIAIPPTDPRTAAVLQGESGAGP